MSEKINHPLPVSVLDGDIAILGRKGGGKTYTAKGLVELLLTLGRRVLILDPLGVWAGLRTSADGKGAGFPIAIFGGEHADLPLETTAAEPMANMIAKENFPVVFDLSEMIKSDQQSFLYAFLKELRRVNKDALTVVLEEADVFAPQNPMNDGSRLLHSEIDWIARRGRSRGFRLLTITQRPARLSKDVLTQASTLIAHRLPAPQDRDAVKAWVDGNGDRDAAKQVVDTLARLGVGEAWVWAPEQDILKRMKFPKITTLDTSATPKAGAKRIEAKTLAQVDLTGIRAALAAVATEKVAGPDKGAGAVKTWDQTKAIAQAKAEGFAQGVRAAAERAGCASLKFGAAIEELVLAKSGLSIGSAIAADIMALIGAPDHRPENAVTGHGDTGGARNIPTTPRHHVAPSSPPAGQIAASFIASGLSPTAAKVLGVLQAAHPLSLKYRAAACAKIAPANDPTMPRITASYSSGPLSQIPDHPPVAMRMSRMI